MNRDTTSRTRGLDRKEASEWLKREYSINRAPRTLAKEAVTGTGPAFYRAGRAVRYDIEDLKAWAEAKIGPKVRSTSELSFLSSNALGGLS
jgi:hypothetical protein